jgi:hypothetical protein
VVPVLGLPGPDGVFTVEFGEAFDPGDPSWTKDERQVHMVRQYARFLERTFLRDPFLLRHEFCGFHARGTWNAAAVWGGAEPASAEG